MLKTMFVALYFMNPNGVPQIETQLFDTMEECSAYMGEVGRELKFWMESGGKTNGSQKMPWITWRMHCKSLNPKWEAVR